MKETSFKDFIEIQRGHDLPKKDRVAGNIPVVGSNGIVGSHNSSKGKVPGITIGRSGSIGNVFYFNEPYFPLNTTLYVIDFKDNHERFVYYFLKNFDFTSFDSGSVQPSLNRNYIYTTKIKYPNFKEQKKIAEFLENFDKKIEFNQQMDENFEEIAKTLFKSWFIDFDPVRAKAEGRGTGFPKEISDLFPSELIDSELGEVPKGWHATDLKSVAKISGGKVLDKTEFDELGEVPVYGGNGIMGWTNKSNISDFAILFGRVGANCGSIHWVYETAWVGNNASSIVPLNHGEFVLQTLLMKDFENLRSGSAQPFISNSALGSIRILMPSDDILDHYCRLIHSIRLRQVLISNENKLLSKLRDTLMPKLISGELKIPDAESLIQEANI